MKPNKKHKQKKKKQWKRINKEREREKEKKIINFQYPRVEKLHFYFGKFTK